MTGHVTTAGAASRTAAPPLRFTELAVRYRRADRLAVDGVTFDVPAGRVTAVVGPNGSGKSTIVRALLRRVALERGRIDVHGRPLDTLAVREFARAVAVVPQREEPALPLSVREFVTLGRHAHRGAFGATSVADAQRVPAALERVGASHTMHRRTDELSGGEWQRVRIARALVQDTATLVLDEPTTFLDVAHEMAVFELVDALAADGHGVLLISHQLNLVARFASHIVLLHDGRVAAAGRADDIMRGEILERVYEWPLVVTRDPAVGAPSLLPLRGGARRGVDRRGAPSDGAGR